MSGAFFDRYSRFYGTSQTTPWPDRLDARHKVIIEGNREIIRGRQILDVASHDGRWSFAAIKAGADHVTGIEARSHLIENANANFDAYGIPKEKYRFVHGDAFEVLRAEPLKVDTVLLLGFFYHTADHMLLLKLLTLRARPAIIIDTAISKSPDAVVDLREEDTAVESNAAGKESKALVGYPSRGAIQLFAKQIGYSMTELDWGQFLHLEGLPDYRNDGRSTFILTPENRV
jgi:predicted nicotinamide N-methyase